MGSRAAHISSCPSPSRYSKNNPKNTMKPAVLFLFIALLLIGIPMQAQTFTKECSTGQELRYMVLSDRKTVEVSWVSDMGASSNAIIPDKVSYKGRKYTVTAIGRRAFVICDSMISVTLPNTITTIGDGAFDGCLNLTSIILPDSITSIGWSTFSDCRSLHSITIPHSVTSIGDHAFSKCENLTSITLSNTITTIGDGAFWGCQNLTSITLPNSLTTISKRMFYQCSSLTTITIPSSVTSIEEWAFAKCESLTSITLPNSVTTIGEWAFSGCLNLTAITLPNTLASIGKRAFHNCLNINSLTIPSSVVSIGDEAFSECVSMTSVLIPNSVTEIGHEIFANCHSLHNVVIASDNPVYQLSSTNVGDSERILLIDKRTGHEFEAKGDIILRDPEVRAMFPGGVDSLKKFLFENLEYPPIHGSFQGVVILEFVVETDGSITSVNVLLSLHKILDEEAIRVVKAMPKWNPAQDDGHPCRSYYQLPITYCLR